MIEVEKGWYSVKKCRENPTKLYVFGDNWEGVGKGGQAIIRDEPNTFGVSSKYNCMESYSDKRYYENCMTIDFETDALLEIGGMYEAIVFPFNGIGTGLAQLPQISPRTFIYLSKVLLNKFNFNNLAGLYSK